MIITLTIHRKAIAMIELIFAIVIMGIVMLSAPLMLTTATKSSEVTFQQESIAIIATHANALLTYAWDEANTDSAFASTLSILSTNSRTTQLDRNDTRAMLSSMRRYKSSITTFASTSFGESVDPSDTINDDVDDFNGFNNSLSITAYSGSTTTDENEYIDINININTQVAYGPDIPSSANFSTCTSTTGCTFSHPFTTPVPAGVITTNIKIIRSELNSTAVVGKKILLKSFICNIGSATPRSEIF